MKKYIPVGFIIFTFIGYLTSQVLFNSTDSTAKPSEKLKKEFAHYENVLKKAEFEGLDGTVLSQLNKKHKVVIVNFWATWCLPCLEELPSMVELRKKYSEKDVLILTINTDEKKDIKAVKKMMERFDINFPVVRDYQGNHVKDFLVDAIPVTIIFSRGKVIQIKNETVDFVSGEFLQKIDNLLKS